MAKSVQLRYKNEKDNKVQRTFYYTQKKDIEDVRMACNIIFNGRDTVTNNKNKKESIKVFEMWWLYRRMQKVSWIDEMFE